MPRISGAHTYIPWDRAPSDSSPRARTGFYVLDPTSHGKRLILGPFMGQVACQTIDFGRGVCGTAAAAKQTQLVPDVDAFPGHIACDGASRSEIVVPVTVDVVSPEEGGHVEKKVVGISESAPRLVPSYSYFSCFSFGPCSPWVGFELLLVWTAATVPWSRDLRLW